MYYLYIYVYIYIYLYMLAYVHASVLCREQLEPRPFWLKLLTTRIVLHIRFFVCRSGVQDELDAVLDYLKQLEGKCVAKAESYAV